MNQPPKHIVPYGTAGTGKSHFASTLPTPQFVAMFDPYGKEVPYTDGMFVDTYEGADISIQPTRIVINGNYIAIPTWDCFEDPDCNKFIRRIVWLHDQTTKTPQAYAAFQALLPKMPKLLQDLGIATFILDSVTMMSRTMRAAAEAGQIGNPSEKSERGYAGLAAKETEWVSSFINDLAINTVLICHSNYDTSADRHPDLPSVGVHAYGKMRGQLLITSGDVYRTFVQDGQYKMHVTADAVHAGNNSMKLSGTFPNDWKEVVKANKTNVTFIKRERIAK